MCRGKIFPRENWPSLYTAPEKPRPLPAAYIDSMQASEPPEGLPLVAEWGDGKCKVQFSLLGAHIHNVQPTGVAFSTTRQQGRAMSAIGKAILDAVADSKAKLIDVRISTPPVVLQSQPNAFSAWLSGTQLFLLDFEAMVGQKPACPQCGLNDRVQKFSVADNAKSCKGDGVNGCHTVYICSRRRRCVACKFFV